MPCRQSWTLLRTKSYRGPLAALFLIEAEMKRVRIRDIIFQECVRTGIPFSVLIGPLRTKSIAHARQYAIWRCRKETDASLKQIGICFGDKDHTTILHAIKKIESMPPDSRMFMPDKKDMSDTEPFMIDISDLREKVEEISRPKVVFPIKPIYKVA
jgi:hypothetical protein